LPGPFNKTISSAISQIKRDLLAEEAKNAWNERDLQFLIGQVLEENLQSDIDSGIAIHYDIPLSAAKYWWGNPWFTSALSDLRKALKEIGERAPKIDLLGFKYTDNPTKPPFPFTAEVPRDLRGVYLEGQQLENCY